MANRYILLFLFSTSSDEIRPHGSQGGSGSPHLGGGTEVGTRERRAEVRKLSLFTPTQWRRHDAADAAQGRLRTAVTGLPLNKAVTCHTGTRVVPSYSFGSQQQIIVSVPLLPKPSTV